jgi:hypothetical protein
MRICKRFFGELKRVEATISKRLCIARFSSQAGGASQDSAKEEPKKISPKVYSFAESFVIPSYIWEERHVYQDDKTLPKVLK